MPILPAGLADISELLPLVNSAFRGDSARRGWTHEADLLLGTQRTDAATLEEMMRSEGAVVLKYCNDAGAIEGCVYLQRKKRGVYLGMLTVLPDLQGGGIGKQLLAAAETFAREQEAPCIYMTVFSARTELLAWYERHGYRRTGEVRPYEGKPEFGVPTRALEFFILEKRMD